MTPVFSSHYSYGRSILTLDSESNEGGADSIIEMCADNDIKTLILVEDNLTSFMKAVKVCKSNKLDLYFGLRLNFCNDGDMVKEDEHSSDHKNIIFAKDDEGCKLLNKIYSKAFTDGHGRIEYKSFKKYWNPNHLSFVVPFYDSYLYMNSMQHNKNCVPDLDGLNAVFWIEDNGLPFDKLMERKVMKQGGKTHKVKTILYKDREDVEALQVYKNICHRSFGSQAHLSHPKLDHFGSEEFCLESYLEAK